MKKITALILAAAILLPTMAWARKKSERAGSEKVAIIAHRGFWNCEEAGYAKNSLAALRCAQQAGFRGSEFDVNMTADSVLLVYHDSDIEGKKIERHPYSEFKDFRIANGETIPTIDEYLIQGAERPETMLVYELKKHSCDAVEDTFVDLSIKKLEEHGLLDPERVMFISFSWHICERLAQKLPGFTVQYLGSERKPAKVNAGGVNGIDYRHTILSLNGKWVEQAHRLEMSVNAWTVNEEKDMMKMFEAGVDQLTTDQPLEARALMHKLGIEEVL